MSKNYSLSQSINTLNNNLAVTVGTITPESTITTTTNELRQKAGWVQVAFVITKVDSSVFTGRTLVGTIPVGYRPIVSDFRMISGSKTIGGVVDTYASCYINTSGQIYIDVIPADCKQIRISLVYYKG